VKAIVQDRYGSVDVLRLAEIERPLPAEGEAVVRVRAAGVDAGVWHTMAGQPYVMRVTGFGFRAPKNRVRGLDLAGVLESVGPGVTAFEPGDKVFGIGRGSFAEYARADVDRIVPLPENVTFSQAAAVPVSGCTALQALRKAKVDEGQRVLVTGAGGGVGSFAVQLAKAMGAHVTGVSGRSRVETVRAAGADRVIDRTKEDFTQRDDQFDVIVDTAGNLPVSRLRGALAPAGTVVFVGGEGGGRLFGGIGRQMRAGFLRGDQNFKALLAKQTKPDLEYLRSRLEEGTMKPIVDRTFPLAEAPEAIRYVHEGRARGKVVLTVADG
jgi:NADPH:quinone reductase-like Zn-dependent oxidoreductase